MPKTISDKSTKTEILEAYNEMLQKMKEQKSVDVKAIKKELRRKRRLKRPQCTRLRR